MIECPQYLLMEDNSEASRTELRSSTVVDDTPFY